MIDVLAGRLPLVAFLLWACSTGAHSSPGGEAVAGNDTLAVAENRMGLDANAPSDTSSGSLTTDADPSSEYYPNLPSFSCTYAYAKAGATADYGETCATNADCQYETCMLPGMKGNFTNEVFGFCTRGCDCDDSDGSALTIEEEKRYRCFYPGGCMVGVSKGELRHAVLGCSSLADCQALDPRWTDCRMPMCGPLSKVCHADKP